MEEKKEYLNEEQFQKNKKKIIKISLIVLIAGVLIGVGLIITGVVKSKNDETTLPKINLEVDEKTEKMGNSQAFDNITGSFGTFSKEFEDSRKKIKVAPYYMFGSFIILASAMVAGGIYFFAIRREIAAFQTQQVMPIAQEGMEKMAPSIGKVGGEIAREVAKAKKEVE